MVSGENFAYKRWVQIMIKFPHKTQTQQISFAQPFIFLTQLYTYKSVY